MGHSILVRLAVGTDEHTSLVDVVTKHLTDIGHEVVMVADGESWRM